MATVSETILFQAWTNFTITLASLASSTVGVGRQSTLVSNSSNYPGVEIHLKAKLGSSPAAGTVQVYLLRGGSATNTDSAGASDAGITVITADQIASLPTLASPSTGDVLDYAFMVPESLGPIGDTWGIAVVQNTTVNFNGTGSNFVAEYRYFQRQFA